MCSSLLTIRSIVFPYIFVNVFSKYFPKNTKNIPNNAKSLSEFQREQERNWQEILIEEHMYQYESQGVEHKEAMKQVAKDRGISKREVYQYLLKKLDG